MAALHIPMNGLICHFHTKSSKVRERRSNWLRAPGYRWTCHALYGKHPFSRIHAFKITRDRGKWKGNRQARGRDIFLTLKKTKSPLIYKIHPNCSVWTMWVRLCGWHNRDFLHTWSSGSRVLVCRLLTQNWS